MKLTVQTFLTLDGVMQAPGGPEEDPSEAFTHGGWQAPFPDPAVSEFVTELAFHVVNLAICVNPVRIAVGGGMVRSWDQLRDGLRRALDAAVPYPPELVPAEFPFDAPLMGALALGTAAARQMYPMHETAPVTPA